jgi:hypothetical protein
LNQKIKFGELMVLLVCLALAIFMTVEVAHFHDSGIDSAHCQLCASAHIAVDSQPAWLTSHVLRLIELVPTQDVSPRAGPVILTAYSRPPPVVSI